MSESRTLDYASPRTAEPMLFVESRDGRLVLTMEKPSMRRVLVATYVPIVVMLLTLIGGICACGMTFVALSGPGEHWMLATFGACGMAVVFLWLVWQTWERVGIVTRLAVEGPLVTWMRLTPWGERRGSCDARHFTTVDVAELWRSRHALFMSRGGYRETVAFVGCARADLERAAEALRDAIRNTNDVL